MTPLKFANSTFRILPPQECELAAVFHYHLGQDLPQIDLGPVACAATGASMADVMGMVQATRITARTADRAMTAADLSAAVGDRHPRFPTPCVCGSRSTGPLTSWQPTSRASQNPTR